VSERPAVPGSVSARGKRWLAQLPPSMGRRGKIHDTEIEAWLWLQSEVAKKTLGIREPTDDPGQVLVGTLIDKWLAGHTLKESSRGDYRIRIDKHIKAHALGLIPIGDVRGMDVDQALSSTPMNWTRIHVAKILSTFFDWAENNRFTVGNPYRQSQAKRTCQLTYRVVERRESSDSVWTPEQFVTFVEHESDPVYRDYWVFVAATGARRGESIGARWSNMHTVDGWCWLADNITTAGNEIIHSDTPKNWKRRKAYFGPVVSKMLLARKDEQEAYRMASSRAMRTEWTTDWVFDRRRGKGPRFFPGVHLAPATVTQRFNRQADELGLPHLAGPHGLRRTFATIAETEGFRPAVLTAAMGHTPDIHGLYPKAVESDMQHLAAHLADLILPNG
jgi:integrase